MNGLFLRIDNPVFPHMGLQIFPELYQRVVLLVRGGQDLDEGGYGKTSPRRFIALQGEVVDLEKEVYLM
ncbi:MAG: hypothetical protein LBR93_11095 [Treponema sp.]|jgi:hypothetical protein|nr:hypothetical protein [Treponema sp.]